MPWARHLTCEDSSFAFSGGKLVEIFSNSLKSIKPWPVYAFVYQLFGYSGGL